MVTVEAGFAWTQTAIAVEVTRARGAEADALGAAALPTQTLESGNALVGVLADRRHGARRGRSFAHAVAAQALTAVFPIA